MNVLNLESAAVGLAPRPRRVVITTLGSLGDLHPYLAVALCLRARGHSVCFATSDCYRSKIEKTGLEYRLLRPDSTWVSDPVLVQRYMAFRSGTVRIVKEHMLPALRDSYADTLAACEGADVVVSHPMTAFSTRLVAEKTGIPWASTMFSPLGFFSACDLPVLPLVPILSQRLRFLGPRFWRPMIGLGKRATRFLAKPWYAFRDELGLPPARDKNPISDSHSPQLLLALFSSLLAQQQPDWPSSTVITGFPFYDQDGRSGLSPELTRFLEAGPPPIVFTLGSSAEKLAGRFYEQSIGTVESLGRRAVLVTGSDARRVQVELPPSVMRVDYAPFAELFDRAVAVVHHGGIGTTALALRAGRPMLVIPFSHDNPDNAARVTRLGVARTLSSARYRVPRLTDELRPLLTNPVYATNAESVGRRIREEDGVTSACKAIESLLDKVLSHNRTLD